MRIMETRNNPDFTVTGKTTEIFKMEKIDRLVGFSHDTSTGEFNIIADGKKRVRIEGSLSIEDFGVADLVVNTILYINGSQVRRDSDFISSITPNRKSIDFWYEIDVFETDKITIGIFADQNITILANGQLSYVVVKEVTP